MTRLPILRVRDATGDVHETWLHDEGGLAIEDAGGARPIAPAHVVAVFERYGKPLAVAVPAPDGKAQVALVLGDGTRGCVRAFRFRGYGDVEPTDYLLLDLDGREPIAGPATLLGAAIDHLSRAVPR